MTTNTPNPEYVHTPLDDASDELQDFISDFMNKCAQSIDLDRALSSIPAISESDHLLDLSGDLEGEIVAMAYELVRKHQRLTQRIANPTFPFDSLDEGYFCPTCGYVDEMTIEAIENHPPTPPQPSRPTRPTWGGNRGRWINRYEHEELLKEIQINHGSFDPGQAERARNITELVKNFAPDFYSMDENERGLLILRSADWDWIEWNTHPQEVNTGRRLWGQEATEPPIGYQGWEVDAGL
jgi:hypothetical protein